MSPEICYFPATTPSTEIAQCRVQSCNTLAAARQNLQPRTAPLKGRLMWGEQTGESGRPRGHAKCKGNMTLLQLPNGDITICSATLLRISQLFPRVLQKKKGKKRGESFSASEFKGNWVWPDHLLFITSVFLVPRVGDKCPESAGKTKSSRMWEAVYHRSDVNKECPCQRISLDHDDWCEASLDPLMSLLAIKPRAVYLCGGLLWISIITSSDVLPQLELVQMWLKRVSRDARMNRLHEFLSVV